MDIDFAEFAPENLAKDTLWNGSISLDWQEVRGLDGDGYEIALPPISAAVLDEYMPDWKEEFPLSDFDGEEDDRLEAAREEFNGGNDRYYEWEESFEPVMNYAYPIELRHNADREGCAALIEAFAGCVTLVTVDRQDYLALTGGGMDLSWNICAAFIACKCMPPLKYLSDLPRMASGGKYQSNLPDNIAALVVACIPVAAEILRNRADWLERDIAGLINAEAE